MGDGEVDVPSKTDKSSSTQEQLPPSSPAAVYPDWASYQAYYAAAGTTSMPPAGFYHSPVASTPQGHPFMWGPQIMSPYGTPPAYVTMYPPGGMYPHPSMPLGSHSYSPYTVPSTNGTVEAPVAGAVGTELDGKSIEGKERSPIKRSKGSFGNLDTPTGKCNETGKSSGASSQSGDSGSEGSNEDSDTNSQNGSQQKQYSEHGSGDAAEEAHKGSTSQSLPAPIILNHSVPVVAIPPGGLVSPTTALNIGRDYWAGPAPISAIQGKLPASPPAAVMVPSALTGSHDRVPSNVWVQDERELKRQKRKQSNRESARRSRLRKQAECEELSRRVVDLMDDNVLLKEELERLRGENEKLTSENASLTEKLIEVGGEESNIADGDGDDKRNPISSDR